MDLQHSRLLRETVNVITFDFVQQAKDLLAKDEIMGDLNNLVVNEDNPFERYQPRNQWQRDELMDGSAVQTAYDTLGVCERNGTFLIPVIMYIDKMAWCALGRTGVEPLMFTLGIFRRHIRQEGKNWKHLGFVPDLDQRSSALKRVVENFLKGPVSDLSI